MSTFILHGMVILFVAAFAATMNDPSTAQTHPATKPDTSAEQTGHGGFGPGTLIVLNKAEASASLVDLVTGEERARLETGDGPHEVAISPDGKTAVVGNYGQRTPGGTLTIIDLEDKTVQRTIDLEKYHRPHGIEFFDDGRRIVVTCEHEQKLLIVDVERGEVLDAIDTDARISHMVALSPDEQRAYVANIGSDSLTVIDVDRGERVKTIETGGGAEGVDVSPDGSEVWVSNRAGDTVTVIDAQSLEAIATLECPSFPIRVKFTPDGSKVLVSNARSGDVAVFDATSRELIKRIPMEATAAEKKDDRLFGDRFGESPVPVGILVHPEGRYAYVANTNADVITVIDLKTLTIAGRLKAGKEPDGLGWTAVEVSR